MPEYNAPLRDTKFVMQELLNCNEHYQHLGYQDATPDMLDAILSEAAKFSENVIAPINASGDKEGCRWENGTVTTPTGFKEAYQQYVEGGWPTFTHRTEFGGQGLPYSLNSHVTEILSAANNSFSIYPALSHGASATIEAHGTKEQQAMFMPKIVEGIWTGTMCLTEPQCGTDLGLLRTKAELNEDGTYAITGTKIFISGGEQDLSENIIHIVIARIPGSPEGTRGISLFAVPKFNISASGDIEEKNNLSCGSIEHKMGIHANATCVMNFDGAKGYLIGTINKGLSCMFTFMNAARLNVANEGVASADASFQGALAYAKDRLQMRSLSGAKNPDGPADAIIVHPDVRRMLLTQKSIAEGGRAFVGYLSQLVDSTHAEKNPEIKAISESKLSLLTPIAKAFLTELGFEATSHGVQVFGGHGFIQEWGMEQLMRDARISMLYEGTTGIQALDLLARKVLGTKGEIMKPFANEVAEFCQQNNSTPGMLTFITPIIKYTDEWQSLTHSIGKKALANPDEVGAASVDYLMYSGYVVLGYFWAKMAKVSLDKIAEGSDDAFYQAKLKTAKFYFDRMLPRALGHAACLQTGGESMMALNEDEFIF